MTVCCTIKDKVQLILHTSKRLANQATPIHANIVCPPVCVYLKTMTTCHGVLNLLTSLLWDARALDGREIISIYIYT